MNRYFDTSALLKRYLDEAGRTKVLDYFGSQEGSNVVSEVVLPELSSAFRRAADRKRLSSQDALALLGQARRDLDSLSVAKLDTETLTWAAHLAMARDLRALDSIHLATALEMGCGQIVSSDLDLLKASRLRPFLAPRLRPRAGPRWPRPLP